MMEPFSLEKGFLSPEVILQLRSTWPHWSDRTVHQQRVLGGPSKPSGGSFGEGKGKGKAKKKRHPHHRRYETTGTGRAMVTPCASPRTWAVVMEQETENGARKDGTCVRNQNISNHMDSVLLKKKFLTVSERLGRHLLHRYFMIELYSGTAKLCSVAKQFGMQGSLVLDKMRKRGARSTISVFDILNPK